MLDIAQILSQPEQQNPSAVMITDAQDDIEYVNLKFTHITGYVPDEVIGKTPRILKSDQTSVGEHQELWRAIKAGGDRDIRRCSGPHL